jgi:hypothetical protein
MMDLHRLLAGALVIALAFGSLIAAGPALPRSGWLSLSETTPIRTSAPTSNSSMRSAMRAPCATP